MRYIDIKPGESIVIIGVGAQPEPEPEVPPLVESLNVLLTIDGVNIFVNEDMSYVCFTSDLDVCNDGSGPSHGDKTYQSMTAYYNGGKYLNADKDKYIVVPPQIRSMVPGVVMGCQGKVTREGGDDTHLGVVGDIGPDYTTGECAYCLAKVVNPSVGHNSGDKKRVYFYELWPGVPAVVDGKQYKLEPAGG
jgi:hypothetical protein